MERVLQFGTGRFLRGFVDAFIDDAERARLAGGEGPVRAVTALESTGSGMAARLAAQGCAYRLDTRGLDAGQVVETSRVVRVIDGVIDASTDDTGLRTAALDPALRFIVSNTTEAGYAPGGYPSRLAAVLADRARASLPGLVILPCELVERNGDRLLELVLADARGTGLEPRVVDHIRDANTWAVTLVDRIATAGDPTGDGQDDALAVSVEPFASWVVEAPSGTPLIEHPAVTRTADVTPYALRKIRILNGAHTALVARTRHGRQVLVREAMADPTIADWLESLLIDEIVPALGERIVDGEAFARTVLERFRNPFLDHRLGDIAQNHEQKLAIRLLPTYHDHVARFGRPPRLLEQVLKGEGLLP